MTLRHKKQDISTYSHEVAPPRVRPQVGKNADGAVEIACPSRNTLPDLMGVKTPEAAHGLFTAAVHALGVNSDVYLPMMTAIFAEIEPRDAVEAMLVSQMTATHVMMTGLTNKMMNAGNQSLGAAYEKSITRLSRTYLAQMAALKQYRAKAQQVVRVERVTVQEGGHAIVGTVEAG